MNVAQARGALTFPALPSGLDTPRVVVDLGRVEANIARLQGAMDARGIALRPHAKTHKSVAVARLQIAAGARGITVGTLGEAEVFVAAGIDDVFLAYPVWAVGPKAARLRAAHDAARRLRVGVDSIGGVGHLAAAVAGSTRPLTVLVEIDPGNRRTGLATSGAAVEVALAARAAGLRVDGVFSHGGHGYGPGKAEGAGADEVRTLEAAALGLRAEGFACATISAGSTPTMVTAAAGGVNEMRAGTYAYGDRQQWALGSVPPEGCAAAVADDRRLGPRRPLRPRCGGQGADEGSRRVADRVRRDRGLSGPRDRTALRLPRRRRGPAGCRSATAR